MKTVRIPALKFSRDLIGNLIGLWGLLMIVLAVGGLTHNWLWGALLAGVFGIVIAYMVQLPDDGKPKE